MRYAIVTSTPNSELFKTNGMDVLTPVNSSGRGQINKPKAARFQLRSDRLRSCMDRTHGEQLFGNMVDAFQGSLRPKIEVRCSRSRRAMQRVDQNTARWTSSVVGRTATGSPTKALPTRYSCPFQVIQPPS